jgi:hypothetical protein
MLNAGYQDALYADFHGGGKWRVYIALAWQNEKGQKGTFSQYRRGVHSLRKKSCLRETMVDSSSPFMNGEAGTAPADALNVLGG